MENQKTQSTAKAICTRCGESVAPGGGKFVNRIWDGDAKGWICDECETGEKNQKTSLAYTPGPWRTDWLGDDRGWILDEHSNYLAQIVTKDDCGFVVSQDQQQANARLMAAAPELFEALDYLLQQTVDMDLGYGIELTEGEKEAREMALKAIAKASIGHEHGHVA